MNFKRILIALTVALCGYGANAQTVVDETTGDTYEYNPHFFIQAQGGAAYTVGEASFGHLITPAAALNVGYNFSPIFGLRIGASGWQAKGSWTTDRHYYKYKYIQGNLDAVFNLTNAFCGWKPKRFFNGYAFVGAAFNHSFDNDEALALVAEGHQLSYAWSPVRNFVVGRVGLGANFRLCDWAAFNIEVNANGLSDHFNSKHGGNWDWQFNALAGFTFTLGKSYKVTPAPLPAPAPEPVKEEPVAEPAPAPAPAPVKEEPKPQPKIAPFQCDVFFTLNSSSISKSEMQKVEKLAKFLNEYPSANVVITGYADKGTGSAGVNQKISQRRAAKVAAALVERGVDSSRITTDAKGDTVQPFAVNDDNRVAICIAEQ
jgi:outer membrane protein OmpA-like peptidoglycan-associated protein